MRFRKLSEYTMLANKAIGMPGTMVKKDKYLFHWIEGTTHPILNNENHNSLKQEIHMLPTM